MRQIDRLADTLSVTVRRASPDTLSLVEPKPYLVHEAMVQHYLSYQRWFLALKGMWVLYLARDARV